MTATLLRAPLPRARTLPVPLPVERVASGGLGTVPSKPPTQPDPEGRAGSAWLNAREAADLRRTLGLT